MFRVPWQDDKGQFQVNRGFRIQMNSAIGPYKGGLRFHPTVCASILKFLAFEQVFKNSLTTLPMGGGKGGSDFDPKGKSDNEVMRFCQSFMTELFRHIGPDTDVPAGDIGVGGREIGFLFGQYKRLANEFTGVLTGKGLNWGGSLIRPEATGYGAVYFAQEMLKTRGESIEGKVCTVSGSGNVAQYTVEKLIRCGAKAGHPVGLQRVHLRQGRHQRGEAGLGDGPQERAPRPDQGIRGEVRRQVRGGPAALGHRVRLRLPLRHPERDQRRRRQEAARQRLHPGVRRRPTCPRTRRPSTSSWPRRCSTGRARRPTRAAWPPRGLEMCQNSMRLPWTREEVDKRLHQIMVTIHKNAYNTAAEYGEPGNYVVGANIAGFVKVADAMLDQGLV